MSSAFKHLQWWWYERSYKQKEVLLIGVGSLEKSVLASFPKDVLLVDIMALINTMVFELP